MMYTVKEIYYTLQGEGAQAGRAAVFLRFAGCNLWSGREADRAGAVCRFCDTDFIGTDGPGGGKFADAGELADRVFRTWPHAGSGRRAKPYVVITGGEPLLQLDEDLIGALKERHFEVGIETNGTLNAPASLDWICVSPKARAPLAQRTGDELKLVYPQEDADPELYEGLDFGYFFLQPLDNAYRARHIAAAAAYCLEHPQWRLSLQSHKFAGLP
jgi:7-carboxy-7-deazaguanine synthase